MADCLKFDSIHCSSDKVGVIEYLNNIFHFFTLTFLKLIYPTAQVLCVNLFSHVSLISVENVDLRYDK